jgi:hypothetical protein
MGLQNHVSIYPLSTCRPTQNKRVNGREYVFGLWNYNFFSQTLTGTKFGTGRFPFHIMDDSDLQARQQA